MQIKLYKALYRNLISYASVAGVDESALQKYFIPEGNTSSNSILFRLCSSLQNSGMMRNSIKFNDKDTRYRDIVKKVLFGFNTEKSAATYSDWESIYNAMLAGGITDNGSKEKKESNWEKYCRGLYDGLRFLAYGNGERIIKDLVAVSALTDQELKEIYTISNQIHGLGFPLTCDWLKECGCTWLAKPDVHISRVVKYLKSDEKFKDKDILMMMCHSI